MTAQVLNDRTAFEQLLGQLMSNSNEQRSQAEALFNECKHHAAPCVAMLMQTLQQCQDLTVRSLAAVLLRKVLTKDNPSLWPSLDSNAKAAVKSELLKTMTTEAHRTNLKKICDTVAELAAGTSSESWPELIPFLMHCVQSNNPQLMEAALLIFAELAAYQLKPVLDEVQALHGALTMCLDTASLEVRLAAMKASVAVIDAVNSQQQREPFQLLIPKMLETIGQALNAGKEEDAQEAVELLIELAEAHPRFLRRQLEPLLNAMLQVGEATNLDSATRQLAAEFVVTLCEARDKAPGMMRKLPQFVGRLFHCLVGFLLDIEDAPEWHRGDSELYETEGEGDLYDVGQECLDRVALALGGNTIAPLAQASFPQLMSDQDWRKRHAALICLAQIAEGCVKVMTPNMQALVQMGIMAWWGAETLRMLQGLQDSHAKVRWAACQALGQMCTDLGPHIQQQHHSTILPALIKAMQDFNAPRVQAHAGAAIVNFSENSSTSIMAPYLESLVATLLQILQRGTRMVQEAALTALASVADASQQQFVTYFDAVMPLLVNVLLHATDKQSRLLRAKALECVSLVGMAVGRDRFRQHAHDVMTFISNLQSQSSDTDDPTSSYLLQAGARICKCLKEEFLPYLGAVMPQLLASAQLKPEVDVRDADSEGENDDDDDEVETIYLGDRKISIRTSSLEEKATACNMISCYVDELQDGFLQYIEQVAQIMVPLLKFYFHEDVRSAAVTTLPELLTAALTAVEKKAILAATGAPVTMQYVQELVNYMWEPLLEAMGKEPELEVLYAMLDATENIVDSAGGHQLLTMQQISGLFEVFKTVLAGSEQRRTERMARRQQEDFDEEEAEALAEELEQEDDVLNQLEACIGEVLRCYGDGAMPLLEQLLEPIGALLDKGRTAEERRVAVCIMDDILEHCPQGTDKYVGTILPVLLSAAGDKDANLRQCAAYGLGLVAQHRQQHFKPVVTQAVQLLTTIIAHPEAQSSDNVLATDNAVSALGRVLEFHSDVVDGATIGALWLNALPLKADAAEAKFAHSQLVRLVETSDVRVLGEGNVHLHKIVQVMVEVLSRGTELIEEDAARRMVTLLQQMQQALPAQVFQNLYAALEPSAQATLQAALQGQPAPAQ